MITAMMPVFNAEQFVGAAIESVLGQTEADLELIIVDDGSTDRSEDVIRSYSDSRIRYLKTEHVSCASARNVALDHARGDYIVFQDADDVSAPARFATLKRQFTSDAVGFVHSDVMLIDQHEQPIGYWQVMQLERARVLRSFLKMDSPFVNVSIMVRSEILQAYRYDTALPIGEDTDVVSAFSLHCDSIHVGEPLYFYRRHASNVTNRADYEMRAQLVRKFLGRHSLEELVPELDWASSDRTGNQARAKALIALFLARRGMGPDAQRWFNEASAQATGNEEASRFVTGIGHIVNQSWEAAHIMLSACAVQGPVVQNYLGEIQGFRGDIQAARAHFLAALAGNPCYNEPLDNLAALGASRSLLLLGSPLFKFGNPGSR
jgi:glycosyltransferase involved in cell wall biosynthesis